MVRKQLFNWGLATVRQPLRVETRGVYPVFRIVYSGTDTTHLTLNGKEQTLHPETFLLIHPQVEVCISKPGETTVLLWFTPELIANYPPRVHYIHENFLFAKTEGLLVKNEFVLYDDLRRQYLLPFLEALPGAGFRKNIFINFLEYLLIRVVLATDPSLQHQRNHAYEKKIAEDFKDLLQKNAGRQYSMDQYASLLHISKRTLDRAMQVVYGCTAKKWWETYILEWARRDLAQTDIPVKNLSLELGFSQDSNFINFFKKHTGWSPSQYRERANRKEKTQTGSCNIS